MTYKYTVLGPTLSTINLLIRMLIAQVDLLPASSAAYAGLLISQSCIREVYVPKNPQAHSHVIVAQLTSKSLSDMI